MKYILSPLILLLLPFFSHANDGAFRVTGNQLIPMYETDISIKKEILSIHRINATQAQIEVYYEFFNPKLPKAIEVGFEADSPSGDVDKTPDRDGQHPYISGFTVNLNNSAVPFRVSIVHDSLYYRNGKYKSITVASALKESADADEVDFLYVYHFNAVFKQGLNIIRHTYIVDLSNSVDEVYRLDYVLTAAKRWANRQIDDFTLRIDMGEFQDLCIDNDFFASTSEWNTDSTIKSMPVKEGNNGEQQAVRSEFFIRKGTLVFTKKNFRPAGELYLRSFSDYHYKIGLKDSSGEVTYPETFDSKRDKLPFSIDLQGAILPPADEVSKKILRNLPFARRGYVFKSPGLTAYYKKLEWYVPDPAYTPVMNELTKKEQEWLVKIK
jgi:hypothetical protein